KIWTTEKRSKAPPDRSMQGRAYMSPRSTAGWVCRCRGIRSAGMVSQTHVVRTQRTGLQTNFSIKEIAKVAMGTVKWFNSTKGYGFVRPETGSPDVFVQVSGVERAGYSGLAEGARVSYELVTGRNGKVSAENLRVG